MVIETNEQLTECISVQYHLRNIAGDVGACIFEAQKWHDANLAGEAMSFILESDFKVNLEDPASCVKLVANWNKRISTSIGDYHQANSNS